MSKPWAARLRSSPSFIITAVCIGLFTDSITLCSIIPILPSALVTRAGVPEADSQFYISLFMASFSITFFITAPVCGHLSDRLKNKRPLFLWGIVVNIISLLLFMISTSVVGMTVARALQGFSSAAILVIGTAMIKDTLTKEQTGKGMAFTSAAIQLGLIMGPAFGGLIYDTAGYEAVFVAPSILLAITLVLRLLIIENPARQRLSDTESGTLDNHTDDSGETEPLIKSSSSTIIETPGSEDGMTKQPSNHKTILDRFPVLRFFMNGRMVTALFVSMIDATVWGAMESTVPLYVIRTFHWTPSNAGALFLISCTPGILLSYFVGSFIDQSGSLFPAVFGLTFAGAANLLQRLVRSNTLRDKILLAGLFTTSNMSMLFVQLTMSVEIGLAAQEIGDSLEAGGASMVGQGYALYMMVQSFGALLGPVIGGATIEVIGWTGMTTVDGTLLLIGLPFVLCYTGGGLAAWRKRRAGL